MEPKSNLTHVSSVLLSTNYLVSLVTNLVGLGIHRQEKCRRIADLLLGTTL